MKTREHIITSMCLTYRHDYGLRKTANDPLWVAGMTEEESEVLWNQMAQIFDHDIAPHMDFKQDK